MEAPIILVGADSHISIEVIQMRAYHVKLMEHFGTHLLVGLENIAELLPVILYIVTPKDLNNRNEHVLCEFPGANIFLVLH